MKYFMVFLSFSLQIPHSILRQMMTTSFTSSVHCSHYHIIQYCVLYAGEKHFKMIQEFSVQVNGTKVTVVVKTDINPAYLMKRTSQ